MASIRSILMGVVALAASAIPCAGQQAGNDFQKVTAQLDPGGTFYMYTDLRGVTEAVIGAIEPILTQAGNPQMEALPAMIRAGMKGAGLDQIEAFGMSVLPLENNMVRAKSYLKIKEPVGVFALPGRPAAGLEGLKYVPPRAAAASVETINFQAVIPLANRIATGIGGATGEIRIQKALKVLKDAGFDLEAFLAALDGEIGFWLIIDEQREVVLPYSNSGSLRLSRPEVCFMLKTRNNSAYDMIVALALKKSGEAWKVEKDTAGGDALVMAARENPFAYRPLFAQRGNWLMLASSAEDMELALDSARSGKDLRTSEEFAKVAAGMHSNPCAVGWISPQVARFATDILRKVESLEQRDGDRIRVIGELFVKQLPPTHGIVSWSAADPEGISFTTQGDKTGSMFATSGMSPVLPVLAAIAVPNFLEAKVRSKVSRVRSDQRTFATALESYFVDNNAYPVWTTKESDYVTPKGLSDKGVPSFATYKGPVPGSAMTLTTPIAYITSLYPDPFAPAGATFGYYSVKKDDAAGWILISPGPDGKYDLDWKLYDPAVPQPSQALIPFAYDPTNGTVSPGDVFRTKQ